MKKIRIKYEKNEEVKYIGHLDTVTMFDRTFRRANINLKFSKGFNPRANMSFALPTSTGVISECEYMEFEIDNDEIGLEELVSKLNKYLPIGFKVLQAYFIDDKKSLMAKVVEAKYLIKVYFKEDNNNFEKIKDILNKNELLVENKKGTVINIKPYILKLNIERNNNCIDITILGTAGSNNNLRPDLIVKLLQNEKIEIEDFEIIRNELILKE